MNKADDTLPLRLRNWVVPFVAASLYWLYSRTWSIKHINGPGDLKAEAKVYAHWHGDELLLIGAYVRKRMAIMASRSRDGELMKRFLGWLGYRVVRGSSSRGGAGGLKGLIDAVSKSNFHASLAVDGPRGPIYKVKPGIIKLAAETGAALIPGGCACSRRWVFRKAWNLCYVPKPFARGVIVYGDPIHIPKEANAEQLESYRLQLEQTLRQLKIRAEQMFEGEVHPELARAKGIEFNS